MGFGRETLQAVEFSFSPFTCMHKQTKCVICVLWGNERKGVFIMAELSKVP